MTHGSILNEVMGPVMRGPSSSHTAGAHRLGLLSSALLGGRPVVAVVTFDPNGSYGRVYQQQGADLAFAAGIMGWPLTDDRFFSALDVAADEGMDIRFQLEPIPGAQHPNSMLITIESSGGQILELAAQSIGGGVIEVTEIMGWPLRFRGDSHLIVVEAGSENTSQIVDILARDGALLGECEVHERDESVLVVARRRAGLSSADRRSIEDLGPSSIRQAVPHLFVESGDPIFVSAAGLIEYAEQARLTLGQAALKYESELLQVSEDAVIAEMTRRFDVMRESVGLGLSKNPPEMLLLSPSAASIVQAERDGDLPIGGIHARAAARAMAAMHVNGGMGIVCAAPTGGAAGTIPGVICTLVEEKQIDQRGAAMLLLAAGIIGVFVHRRATFAAEVAGCQVEIGAAGAMAAAAVVEWGGGTVSQATDAAAIAFQNTMGLVCDLVQGAVEIPCHTRNAAAASNAFLCADLIIGGYDNPVPLDETIDSVYSVGRMLPPELRCTALGGLATAPSAISLKARR